MFDLRDRFETEDGSRPERAGLDDKLAAAHPLPAFSILRGGDVFDAGGASTTKGVAKETLDYAQSIVIDGVLAGSPSETRVRQDIVSLLKGNPTLVHRLVAGRELKIDVVPGDVDLTALNWPVRVSRRASGLFWDNKDWACAHVAVLERFLEDDGTLVAHEMAHAVHYLALSGAERKLIYDHLRPTFGSPASMDEAFAIYSEREFSVAAFSEKEKRAPGVYGFTRRQWDENHVFTRFMRKLFFPNKPLAGHKTQSAGASAWKKFSGG